ncbi:patatin-like phospholipase family protein [Dyella monticola]|uniref:Patatin-like phospholipase family protein n=1 Tax=Dyella monticola TaxID=1927958 RepID=A0A370WU89_9GAMM|nr:patatin-like phospholipase family protein [Dyella monticola]RDS79621.1 patatin-like phospholipase family protein [Dyella monticola]
MAATKTSSTAVAHHPMQDKYKVTALVLQGGGALGAYQAGVYQALAESGLHPNWIAGISIGALNAAIIAGNAPEHRVERLTEFWDTICKSALWPGRPAFPWPDGLMMPQIFRDSVNTLSAWRTMTEGQSGFFQPRVPPPILQWHGTPATASWYDTAPLRETLERLVDFDRINDARTVRVSVGAVNVRTGNFAYFDNKQGKLRPEHFMASGALPPGFPAVEIDGEYYWDGGMVSNTPLYKVLTERPHRDALIFQVDLWSSVGALPRDMGSVTERAKDIQYSSRTRLVTEYMHQSREQQRLLHDLMELVPQDKRDNPAFHRAQRYANGALTNLIHLIYRDKPYEGHYKDYEFSAATMHEHWQSGLSDMRHTLSRPHWLEPPSPENPFVTHDVHRVLDTDH